MIQFFSNNLHWFWFALFVIFALIEAFTMGLTTIWFSIASFLMIFISFTHMPFLWQLLLACVISAVLLYFTRPLLKKKLKIGEIKTNADALVGKKALVTQEITEFNKGEIKVNGVLWTAQDSEGKSIPKDTEVEIIKIEGATAIVRTKCVSD